MRKEIYARITQQITRQLTPLNKIYTQSSFPFHLCDQVVGPSARRSSRTYPPRDTPDRRLFTAPYRICERGISMALTSTGNIRKVVTTRRTMFYYLRVSIRCTQGNNENFSTLKMSNNIHISLSVVLLYCMYNQGYMCTQFIFSVEWMKLDIFTLYTRPQSLTFIQHIFRFADRTPRGLWGGSAGEEETTTFVNCRGTSWTRQCQKRIWRTRRC